MTMTSKRTSVFLFLILPTFALAQFPSTSTSAIYSQIPKAEKVGDTSYITNPISVSKTRNYVLVKINKNGRYVYRQVNHHGKNCRKIMYDSNNQVRSYWYKYNSWGGSGKGYFVIHYYTNGYIKDYAHIMINTLGNNSEVVLYDSLDYAEEDRANIPYKEYTALKVGRKVFLSLELTERKELRKMKRNRKCRKPFLFQDAPFKFILLENTP